MLQRVQSLLLGLVANFFILMYFIPVFSFWDTTNESSSLQLTALYNIPTMVLNSIIILFSVFIISQFKNRKKQRNYVFILSGIIVINISLFMFYMIQYSAMNQYTLSPEKSIGIYLQLIALILCFFAAKRIKKDDDLVKSVDRIR